MLFWDVVKRLHGGIPVYGEDWKLFLRIVVNGMTHWRQRSDATVRLCDCGRFVHRCFYSKVIDDDMFSSTALVDSVMFMPMMKTILNDFQLMTGRCVDKRDSNITIYHVLNALMSNSETIPIAHRIVALKVFCGHLNVENQCVKNWISMVREMQFQDVFSLPVSVKPEFFDEFVAGFTENFRAAIS